MKKYLRVFFFLFPFVGACDTVEYHIHELEEQSLDLGDSIDLTLVFLGDWSSINDEGIAVHGPPYEVRVEIEGLLDGGYRWTLGEMIFSGADDQNIIAPAVGKAGFTTWADEKTVAVVHRGLDLRTQDYTVSGSLLVETGAATLEYPFSFNVRYQYREERKSSFIEALKGV